MRLLLLLLVLYSVHGDKYTLCLTDPLCRTLYHQYPPNRATFDHIWAKGIGDSATTALRARVAHLHLCPLNERYVVEDGVGTCVCEDGNCRLTPFNNTIMVVTCVACSLFLVGHVLHGFARTVYKETRKR